MTRDEIIQVLKGRNSASKKLVETGIEREKLLGPKEQEKLYKLYEELFKMKPHGFNNVSGEIVDFLAETCDIPRLQAAAFARGNAETAMLYFRDFKENGVFEDAEDIIHAAMMASYWDLLGYIMGTRGHETMN